MSYSAELAVGRMEKKGAVLTSAALLALALAGAGTFSHLLNRLSGHDPSKTIRQALPPGAPPGTPPGATPPGVPPGAVPPGMPPRLGSRPVSRLVPPRGGPTLLQPAYGLHAYRAGV